MKRVLVNLGLGLFALTIVGPILWVLFSSIKPGDRIVATPWSLPTTAHWVNYSNAWQVGGIGANFVNSVIVTLGTLVILLPVGAMAAYVLARYPFPGSKLLFGTFLGGMMFPNFLVIVPLFFLLRSIGLFDTRLGLIAVYVAYSLSFTIFVLSGFFQSLPGELAQAAMIDGCGHTGTFVKVMAPLARPGLIVVGIFNAIGLWNEYALALVLIPSKENYTLPIGIANLVATQQYQSDWGALFAGLVIVMLPVLVVYWIFRDKIHETMLAGAVKG
jgi:N-acetylglucosamine transport system permease protein